MILISLRPLGKCASFRPRSEPSCWMASCSGCAAHCWPSLDFFQRKPVDASANSGEDTSIWILGLAPLRRRISKQCIHPCRRRESNIAFRCESREKAIPCLLESISLRFGVLNGVSHIVRMSASICKWIVGNFLATLAIFGKMQHCWSIFVRFFFSKTPCFAVGRSLSGVFCKGFCQQNPLLFLSELFWFILQYES